MSYVLPVCGYPDLKEAPYTEGGGGSLEICPSCHIQCGYHDASGDDDAGRKAIYTSLREKWIADGMKWKGADAPPVDWNPSKQLENIAAR